MKTRSGRVLRSVAAGALTALLAGAAWAQSPPATQQPAPTSAPTVQGYKITGANVDSVAGKLQEMFGRADVRVFGEQRTGQVIVIGPAAAQREIADWLAGQRLLANGVAAAAQSPRGAAAAPAAPAQPTQPPANQPPQQLVTQSWQLRNLNWKDFETKLIKTWGKALESSQDSVGDIATFRFPPTPGGSSSIVVDRRTSLATIVSPAASAPSWQRLMSVLDSRPTTTNERTALLPLSKADPQTVKKAVGLLQSVLAAAESHRKLHIGQFVGMMFQPDGAGAAQAAGGQAAGAQPEGGNQPAQPPAPPPAQPPPRVPLAPGPTASMIEDIARVGNVRIEILDDAVIISGRQEDVERVQRIIEQIELQSIQFKPDVEIYHLKHVDGQAMNDMLNQIYGVAFPRQGLVSVYPLVKPNALLLIGRKENIPAVVELIVKLDQPVSPDTEFRVFYLRHMSAIDAERTVRTFLAASPGAPANQNNRAGLGTRVNTIAEFRANALIVQASPRDMLEVIKMIESLDIEQPSISSEVRVFKLRNSIAQTLATALTTAITGAAPGAGAGGGGGAQAPASATAPALSLQLLQIGPQGRQLVQSGILTGVRITADTAGNSLIVSGPPSVMDLMAALIEQLDGSPATTAEIKVFTIRSGDATSLAEMLQNLFGATQQQAGGQVGGGQVGGGAGGAGGSTLVPLRFSVDQRTNSIIASGNAADLEVIFAILTRLDEGDIRQRETKVIRLRNAPAVDVSNALSNLLTQQQALIQVAPDLVTPLETLDRQVIVVPEEVTNSLIVAATPRYMQQIEDIVAKLDKRPPMVVIQTVIAEVTLADTEQFGIEWGLQDSLMFDRSIASNRFNLNNSTFPNDNTTASLATRESLAGQALSNFGVARVDPTLGFGGLVLTASNESVQVLLRALEQSSRAEVISRPQIQTLDNQLAYIQVGAQVARIGGQTVTTTGVTNSVTDVPVGIVMQVQPRTSPDGLIVMAISATKSAVGPDATGTVIGTDTNGAPIRSPQILLTTAQTTVSARSGQTIILGGLITKDQAEETRRIPYLGDIPFLGRLFRFDSVRNTRTELLIIMTPYIIESDEQIDWMNLRESERMSWCVADVVNIHGPVQMAGNPAFQGAGPSGFIYPDLQPGAPSIIAPGLPTPATPPGTLAPEPAYEFPPLPPDAQPMGARPSPSTSARRASIYGPTQPPPSVVVPPAASPLPPAAIGSGPAGPLSPPTIQPAVPPAGTDTAYGPMRLPALPPGAPPQFGPPPPQYGPPPVAPAGYQQPAPTIPR